MKTYALNLTQQDIATIAKGLAELPFKISAPLLTKIDAMIADQDRPAVMVPKENKAAGQS